MRDNKYTIYLIETHSGTIPSKIIRVITRYQYSHVMISLDNAFNKMYSFGRRKVNNPLNSGFIIESKNGEFYNKFNNTKCKVYAIKVSKKKYKTLRNILSNYESNPTKYNYDIIGLILKIFRISIRRKDHYVCTQFVAEVIDKTKIYKFGKPYEKIKPIDFEAIPNKKLYYMGKMTNYNVNTLQN